MTVSAPESSKPRKPGQPTGDAESARRGFDDYFTVTHRRRKARYYGRFVGIAKLLLVTLAAALVISLAVWPQFSRKEGPTEIGQTEGIAEEDVESLRITEAKLTGVNKDGRPYMVTFDDASQTSQESDLVKLSAPKADIELEDGAWIALSSPSGRYHRANRILELDGEVHMFHDSGMEMSTGSITFNLESGTGAGYEPLTVQAPFGNFNAREFRIREDTSVFVFRGPVHAVLYSAPELGQ